MSHIGSGKRLADFWHRKIWRPIAPGDRSLNGRALVLARVITITGTVFVETKAASRAAALSFSSLLGLGPLIALVILIAGAALGHSDPHLALNAINRLLRFIAPQVDVYDPASNTGTVAVNPELVSLVNGFITGARSSAAGIVGALSLIAIVLLLLDSIEDVFNEIWGMRRGRPWHLRVAFYWTVLTLGAVLFFAAVTLLGAGAFVNVFVERLPFGAELIRLLRWALPLFSFQLLVLLLTVFYRVIPNTRVHWRSAFAGAMVVAFLLTLNNFLEFLYLRRVLLTKSLYGSVGILPVLMFGLYVFWLYVLIGGQISYAVQNVHNRNARGSAAGGD